MTQPKTAEPILLTTDEAAAYMRLSAGTLANWRSNGEGPKIVRLGDLVRYLPSDLDEFIMSNRRSPALRAEAAA